MREFLGAWPRGGRPSGRSRCCEPPPDPGRLGRRSRRAAGPPAQWQGTAPGSRPQASGRWRGHDLRPPWPGCAGAPGGSTVGPDEIEPVVERDGVDQAFGAGPHVEAGRWPRQPGFQLEGASRRSSAPHAPVGVVRGDRVAQAGHVCDDIPNAAFGRNQTNPEPSARSTGAAEACGLARCATGADRLSPVLARSKLRCEVLPHGPLRSHRLVSRLTQKARVA